MTLKIIILSGINLSANMSNIKILVKEEVESISPYFCYPPPSIILVYLFPLID